MDVEVVSVMEGWEVVDEWVGMMGCGREMDGGRMDDNGGEVRREGREMDGDGRWGVIGVRGMGWSGSGVRQG